MTNAALRGKPDAGNPHVRFDEGEVASAATPRRGSLLYENRINKGSAFVKGVLLAIVGMIVALATADDNHEGELFWGDFWRNWLIIFAGGLAIPYAKYRSSSGEKRKKTGKELIFLTVNGVLFFVFAYSINAIAEKFRIDFFWDKTARCALAASVMMVLAMVPIAIFSVRRTRRARKEYEESGGAQPSFEEGKESRSLKTSESDAMPEVVEMLPVSEDEVMDAGVAPSLDARSRKVERHV